MDNDISNCVDENKLCDDISHLIETTQQRTLRKIARTGVMLYWHIGRRLNHDLFKCGRGEYGTKVVKNLATKLQTKYGQGFGHRVIHRCAQFERMFHDEPVVLSLSTHLKWTHFVALLNIDGELKREFYAEMCRIERWSTPDLAARLTTCCSRGQP